MCTAYKGRIDRVCGTPDYVWRPDGEQLRVRKVKKVATSFASLTALHCDTDVHHFTARNDESSCAP